MKTELLSPAKDKETAIAAIDCGADAVYMGASAFGARRNAPNSLEDIRDVVNYAHKFWAKVFITVNTILDDSELDEAVELVKKLDKIGVDAIIVQDMGLLNRLIKTKINQPPPQPSPVEREHSVPNAISLPIHMSTQCDNRDIEKVNFFNDIGVSRVVLARELSLEKIKEINEANPGLELEAFVHGALCVSYSGQCYLSQYIGGRSANRGECAQPCRKKYSVQTEAGKVIAKDIHALCLKDFNASEYLQEMAKNGVFSFKIEGRLKETSYVKNVTAFYRQELDKFSEKISSGKSFYNFIPNPEKSFNRGFTNYFLKGRENCFNFESPKSKGEYLGKVAEVKKDCFLIKTDKEIHAQDGLSYGDGGFLVNKVESAPTPALPHGEGALLVFPNRKISIKVGENVFRNYDTEFEKQLEYPVKRQIGVNIAVDNEIVITDEDNVSITWAITSKEKAKNPDKMRETFVKQFSKTGESDFYIRDIKIASELPFMPVSEINQMRREIFNKLMQKRLDLYKRETQKELNYTPFYKKEIDYRGNVHNNEAKNFYLQCDCAVCEMSLERQRPERQIELMRTKHCIKYALNMCKSPEKLMLVDEFGVKYPLKFDCRLCEMSVLSPN